MLDHVDSVDVFISVLGEGAVGHHGVLLALVDVVDRDDHWVIVLDGAGQFESGQVVDVEHDLSLRDFLVQPHWHLQVGDVVAAIRGVKHFRGVVGILFLCHAHVYAHVGVTQGVVLEHDRQLGRAFQHFLFSREARLAWGPGYLQP